MPAIASASCALRCATYDRSSVCADSGSLDHDSSALTSASLALCSSAGLTSEARLALACWYALRASASSRGTTVAQPPTDNRDRAMAPDKIRIERCIESSWTEKVWLVAGLLLERSRLVGFLLRFGLHRRFARQRERQLGIGLRAHQLTLGVLGIAVLDELLRVLVLFFGKLQVQRRLRHLGRAELLGG